MNFALTAFLAAAAENLCVLLVTIAPAFHTADDAANQSRQGPEDGRQQNL